MLVPSVLDSSAWSRMNVTRIEVLAAVARNPGPVSGSWCAPSNVLSALAAGMDGLRGGFSGHAAADLGGAGADGIGRGGGEANRAKEGGDAEVSEKSAERWHSSVLGCWSRLRPTVLNRVCKRPGAQVGLGQPFARWFGVCLTV